MNVLSSKLSTKDKFIFVTLISFTLIGMTVTNFSPADAHFYWLVMTLVFAVGAITTGWHQAAENNVKARLVISQLFHWGSTLIAIMVVYAFLHSGQIQNETVSLMILLVLSLSTFLDGIHVGWHFSLLGILLAISTVIVSYIDEYMWIIVIIAIVFIGILFIWNRYLSRNKSE